MLKEKIRFITKKAGPWAIALIAFLFLQNSGMISGIHSISHEAVMATGALDVEITPPIEADFNYNFSIQDINGKTVNFNQYKGKVVFLNIWATWCGPCRAEMNGIQQLYSKLNSKEVQFVMLSVDQNGQAQKVKSYIASKQFTFPVFMPFENLPAQLQVPSIPTTFIIGKDGKLVSKKVGSTNFDTPEFKDFLEGLAKK